MANVKVVLAQINPCVGDFAGNSRKIIAALKAARKDKAAIVVFPELALCGYPPEDLLLKPHFARANRHYLNKIVRSAKGLMALVGFVDTCDGRIYNACALIDNGQVKDVYHKVVLPNYGVFDEKRYFTSGEELVCYQTPSHTFAVTICEDIWNESVIDALKEKDLDFIVNLSSSPFHLGKIPLREKVLSAAAKKTNAFILYCNLVGGQDELVFDGTSKVFSPAGKPVAYAKRFAEDLFGFTLDTKKKYPARSITTHKEKEAFLALQLGLYDYVRKNGFKKVIVGVSGGIDSAVVVALAKLSLGAKNVAALIMPSRYTSKGTFGDAKKICKNLGIKYSVLPIDPIMDVYRECLKPCFASVKKAKEDKTEENIQARIRGNLLMAFSNKFGYLVLNTGNKSEVSCGYCTLYGDMVGGFGLIKDVHKTLVYKLARYINRIHGDVIPLSILKRAPSAELKADQRDQDTLPEYPLLDGILKAYIEKDLSRDAIIAKGYKKNIVEKVLKMVDHNEYKRRQSPVGIKITPRALGRDRRMPITNKFLT